MRLIRELEKLQEERGYLDPASLRELASRLRAPLYRLEGLASFYPHFRTWPVPAVTISVCRDMACHLAGGDGVADALEVELAGRDDVRIEETSCLGCCELAPAGPRHRQRAPTAGGGRKIPGGRWTKRRAKPRQRAAKRHRRCPRWRSPRPKQS